uniref:Uncharacterized protein n=1 Tax=Ciona savignyi TaxID=51511 RepID=H2Y803_CIOSA
FKKFVKHFQRLVVYTLASHIVTYRAEDLDHLEKRLRIEAITSSAGGFSTPACSLRVTSISASLMFSDIDDSVEK